MIRSTWFRRQLAGSLILLSATTPMQAMARTLIGVTMPDTMAVRGDTLRLNGMGVRSFTFLQIHGYVAGLYLAEPAHRADTILTAPGIKLLRIQYVHAASVSQIRSELRQGRKLICTDGCPPADDLAFAQLLDTVHPVKPGDTTTYVFGPLGLQVLFDEQNVAMIRNADFSRRMLGGLLGLHPPSAQLRDGLLGGSTE